MISYCRAYPTAVVAHPWNCAQFFNCSHRQSRLGGYLDECPYPMLYSTEKQICSNFTAVNCKSRPEPKGPCKIKINMDPFSYICNAFDIKSVLYFFSRTGEYRQNLCSNKDKNCVPCPTRLPSCVGLPDGLNSVTGAQWTDKYILCYRNRTIEVNTCKQGVFNPMKRLCDDHVRPGKIFFFQMFSFNYQNVFLVCIFQLMFLL